MNEIRANEGGVDFCNEMKRHHRRQAIDLPPPPQTRVYTYEIAKKMCVKCLPILCAPVKFSLYLYRVMSVDLKQTRDWSARVIILLIARLSIPNLLSFIIKFHRFGEIEKFVGNKFYTFILFRTSG